MGNLASSLPCVVPCGDVSAHRRKTQRPLAFHRVLNQFDDEFSRTRVLALCEVFMSQWQASQQIQGSAGLYLDSSDSHCRAALGQRINEQNRKGRAALHIAAAAGLTKTVKALLDQGADLYIRDNEGMMALHLACQRRHGRVVQVLLQRASQWGEATRYVNSTTNSNMTAIHLAVSSGYLPTVHLLLTEYNPDLSVCTTHNSSEHGYLYPSRSSPLHIAATAGNRDMAQALLECFARKSYTNPTPLVDPRSLIDSRGNLPWQVAFALPMQQLARLIHPDVPLNRFWRPDPVDWPLMEEDSIVTNRGCGVDVPALQALAADVLKRHLLTSLNLLPSAPTAIQTSMSSQEQQQSHTQPSQQSSDCLPILPDLAKPSTSTSTSSSNTLCCTSTSPSSSADSRLLECDDIIAHMATSTKNAGCVAAAHTTRQVADQASDQQSMSSTTLAQCKQLSRPPYHAEVCVGSPSSGSYHKAQAQVYGSNDSLNDESDDEGADVCGICLVSNDLVMYMPCGHESCRSCAAGIVHRMKGGPVTCPFCRVPTRSFRLAPV